MARIVWGDGDTPCDLFLCGERPGWEEARAGRGFVGPAGDELWERFAFCGVLGRQYWYVTNLVKTFSKDPPDRAEVLRWAGELRRELREVQPRLVVTVGAHAMRWFLPDATQETHHGLLFRSPRTDALVLPIVHSSAALRQPDRYQKVLTEDCEAVHAAVENLYAAARGKLATRLNRFVRGGLLADAPLPPCHETRTPQITIKHPTGTVLGCDTEGTPRAPECVTFSDGRTHDLLKAAETYVLRTRYFESGRRFVFHNALNDLQTIAAMLGWDVLDDLQYDDTMLKAYLLGAFMQGLKPLAFRLGIRLNDYDDLLAPLDERTVRQTLQEFYDTHAPLVAAAKARSKNRSQSHAQHARTAGRAGDRTEVPRLVGQDHSPAVPARALTSIKSILTKEADKTPRQRWEASKFAACCPLPPPPTWQTLYETDKDAAIHYACADAHGHYALDEHFAPRIAKEGLARAYRIDRDVLPMVARMQHVGMKVDGKALAQLGIDLGIAYADTCRELSDILGYALNPKAAEDVSHTLFDELDVTPTKLTKSGKYYTTQDKYLEARKHEHEVVPLIMRGREEWKLKSSYADKLPHLLRDGRYYPDFAYTRTASGRLSEPIILLIPKHGGHLPGCEVWDGGRCSCTPWSKRIRKAFIAADGHVLVSCDLSQIELRELAHVSGDRAMIDAYRRGDDLHTLLAHEVLGAPKRKEDQDESKHRFPAKKCNFGAFMGLSPAGLTEQIRAGGNVEWSAGCEGCDDPRADHAGDCASVTFFREYWKARPGVRKYIDARHHEAERQGYVRDRWGAKIYTHGIWSSKFGIRREAERKAQATPIQSGADRVSKLWMKAIWDHVIRPLQRGGKRYCEPWCRVHDDTILEVDERVAKRVKHQMLQLVPQTLSIPTEAEAKIGTDWGALK